MLERRGMTAVHAMAISVVWALSFDAVTFAHIIPPESLHPVAEAYRRCTFVLNMASRGVDERDTPLIAFGEMAFDSSYIFGEPKSESLHDRAHHHAHRSLCRSA